MTYCLVFMTNLQVVLTMKNYKKYCEDKKAHKMYHAIGQRCPCVYECSLCEIHGKPYLHKKSEVVYYWEEGCNKDILCQECVDFAMEVGYKGNPQTEEVE